MLDLDRDRPTSSGELCSRIRDPSSTRSRSSECAEPCSAHFTVRCHVTPNTTGPPGTALLPHFDRVKAPREWFQQDPESVRYHRAVRTRLKVENGTCWEKDAEDGRSHSILIEVLERDMVDLHLDCRIIDVFCRRLAQHGRVTIVGTGAIANSFSEYRIPRGEQQIFVGRDRAASSHSGTTKVPAKNHTWPVCASPQ